MAGYPAWKNYFLEVLTPKVLHILDRLGPKPIMGHIWAVIRTIYGPSITIYGPYMGHIWPIYRPIYEPYMGHIWAHIWAMYGPSSARELKRRRSPLFRVGGLGGANPPGGGGSGGVITPSPLHPPAPYPYPLPPNPR